MPKTLLHSTLGVLALFAAAAAAAASITGSGKPVTQARNVSGFTGNALGLPGRLELTQGDTESVLITADDNVLPEIESVVENATLKLRFRERALSTHRVRIQIKVTVRTLESLAVGGSGDIRSGPLKAGKLTLAVSGSGDLGIASAAATSLVVNISGSGNAKMNGGSVETLNASIAGSGDLDAAKLATRRTSVNVAGSGDACVWASDSLAVNVAGSGSIAYYGDPKVSRTVVGSGSVRRLGASPS